MDNKSGREIFGLALAAGMVVAGVAGVAGVGGASASESILPVPPDASVGSPVGALPPPGLYGDIDLFHLDYKIYNGNGKATAFGDDEVDAAATLVWVPKFQIFGASYAMFATQGFRDVNSLVGGTEVFEDSQPANTLISPIVLSWNLKNGFFASVGLAFDTGAWRYNSSLPVPAWNAANNYWSVLPNAAVSYLNDGWNLTLHPLLTFNTTDPSNGYHSGSALIVDYTATKAFGSMANGFGQISAGFGGTWINQFQNDTVHGAVVGVGPTGNSVGNRAQVFNIGPTVEFDFKPLKITAQYFANVEAKNAGAGNTFWLRVGAPLF